MELLKKIYNFLLDTVQTLLIVFAFFLVIYIFFFRPFQVSGNSMHATFLNKEYILTNLITLRLGKPKIGDVVVFKAPNDPEKDYIKRVIGTPGDTVSIRDGEIYVNGQLLDQSKFLEHGEKTYGGAFLREDEAITVPEDSYFVIGDNRSGSSDSREWGFVPFESLIGQSFLVYWPLDKMQIIKNPYK